MSSDAYETGHVPERDRVGVRTAYRRENGVRPSLRSDAIREALAEANRIFHTSVKVADLASHRRFPDFVLARNHVAWRLRQRGWRLMEIGAHLGGRHHATIMYAIARGRAAAVCSGEVEP